MAQLSEVGGAAAAGHSGAELCAVVVGMRLVVPAGDFRDYVVHGVFRKSNRVAQRGGDVKIIRAVRLLLIEAGDQHVVRDIHAAVRQRFDELYCGKVGAAHYRFRHAVADYLAGNAGEVVNPVDSVVYAFFGDIVAALFHGLHEVALDGVVEFVLRSAHEVDDFAAVVIHDMADHHVSDRLVVVKAVGEALDLAVERNDRTFEIAFYACDKAFPRGNVANAGREDDNAV